MREKLSPWKITYDQFEPSTERLREVLCTLGNGYLGTRGAAPEVSRSETHYPGCYIAGVYNKTPTHIAGRTIYNEDLVNCPNWLLLTFRIDEGDWFDPVTAKLLVYRQELDLRGGVLSRVIRVGDSKGRQTTVETQRIVHMGEPHLAAIRYVITPENYEGRVVIRSALDGTVQNTGVARYRELNCQHLRLRSAGSIGQNGLFLSVKTSHSKIEISEAAKVRLFSNGKELTPKNRTSTEEGEPAYQDFEFLVKKKKRYAIEKIVSVYTSRDEGVQDSLKAAVRAVKEPRRFDALVKTHERAWDLLWKRFDVQIEGDDFSQTVVRLHIFHLLQVASMHNAKIDAAIPARGLHGEAYRGHIFWDQLFTMSFFDLHAPEISKALLMYRYRRLPASRKYAVENGYQGAMFAWQSGSSGVEETQIMHLNPLSGKWGPDASRIQRHVSFAIARNVWEYWVRSGDLDFLVHYGAEILLSIAQFGSSLAKYDRRDRRYHTEGVMGPDEFHERLPGAPKPGFKDNAYTNLLIVWTLLRAGEALALLPTHHKARLVKKLGLTQRELKRWEDISRRMNMIIADDGIISQFEGYFRLKELDWDAYKTKYRNIGRMDRILKAEGKSPDDYKLSKQADVLMLFYLLSLPEIEELFDGLGFRFDKDILKKNYEYYVHRTSHGSTLSKVVHGYVAHLLGKSKESWDWFLEVLRSDLHDTQEGTTPEGIHVGVMGGSIDMVRRAFGGIHVLADRIRMNPKLPRMWQRLNLKILYRNNWISFSITKNEISILVHGPKSKTFSLLMEICGKQVKVPRGKRIKVKYRFLVAAY